jgi:hypothetical protein
LPVEALPRKALPAATQRRIRQRLFGNALVGLAFVGIAFMSSCAPATRYEEPSAVRGYEILVTRRDSLGQGIAEGLKRRGFTVRQRVRGGSRPTAYLLAFTFREAEPPALTWLHVRLADTRTGAIVAAVSLPLDSVGASAADQARMIVDSLAAQAALKSPESPP